MSAPRILVVEDDADMRQLLEDELRVAGYDVVSASSAHEALERFEVGATDAVVTDLIMPGMYGNELLAELHQRDPDVPVVIMTAFATIESAVQSIKEGALHYVSKPFRMEELLAPLELAVRQRAIQRQLVESLVRGTASSPAIVAESAVMRKTLSVIARAAPADSAVLLLGESGTGKELLARALHGGSARRERPFVAVNCSAIPENLLESQLFGHKRGAFTDAREDQRGLFQVAEGGTLFLDEIADLALSLQSKLLRVLQEREVHPLGAASPMAVNVRVVAATHQDLDRRVADGRFRQDLFYRLNVIAVRVPPLRERPDDLRPLVGHLIAKHARRLGRAGPQVDAGVMALLERYAWPGNVRELENTIERALVLGSNSVLRAEDLPDSVRVVAPAAVTGRIRTLAEVEREQILEALRVAQGNKTAAARALGFDRKTLYRKLESYGLGGDPTEA